MMNGVKANSNVNVDKAKSVGEKILSSMHMKLTTQYTFKRKCPGSNYGIKVHVQVDPQLLFQQLIMACDDTQLEELFQ